VTDDADAPADDTAEAEAGGDEPTPDDGRAPGVAFRHDLRRAAREGEAAPGAAFE